MLRARIITALVAIPLLLWLILGGPTLLYNFVVLAFTYLSLREFSAMALGDVHGGTTLATGAGMTIAIAMLIDHTGAAVSAGIVIALSAVLLGALATATNMERSVQGVGQVLLGSLYGGVLLPHLIWLRALDGGPELVCFVIASTFASDASGYFAGRSFGRTKLWPSVSPNKTVEGAVGSILGTLVISQIFGVWVFGLFEPVELFLVAPLMSVLAQLGDLLESMLKRAYGAKDSGWLLPGHGGVLDRTDSLVLPIVFIYYYAIVGGA